MPSDEPAAITKPDNDESPSVLDNDSLPMLFCPVCDARLVSLRCKLLCERCGYFMSCADYY